jgi:hypothetical protein
MLELFPFTERYVTREQKPKPSYYYVRSGTGLHQRIMGHTAHDIYATSIETYCLADQPINHIHKSPICIHVKPSVMLSPFSFAYINERLDL